MKYTVTGISAIVFIDNQQMSSIAFSVEIPKAKTEIDAIMLFQALGIVKVEDTIYMNCAHCVRYLVTTKSKK